MDDKYPIHLKTEQNYSFDRLEKLWDRYPQFHEASVFTTLDELLEEHESYQKDFDEALREEYLERCYDRFLVQLSWTDLPYRRETKRLIEGHADFPENPYVKAFMEQFSDLSTDREAAFIFPESFVSQFFVVMEACKRAREVRVVKPLFPDEEKVHYLAVFDKINMDDVLLMYHLLYSNANPVDFFGGKEALDQRRELDETKRRLCEENGVRLIEWSYELEPTDQNVKMFLQGPDNHTQAGI